MNTSNISQINILQLFTETYYELNKKSTRAKSKIQEIYNELFNFTRSSCYWTRYNLSPSDDNDEQKKYLDGRLSGKYLNEIHNDLINVNFYDKLYIKLLNIYLSTTNYETLNIISQDSMFTRNILGIDCSRNPQYYNKPGLKIHSITDSYRTPLSIHITDSTVHDSRLIKYCLNNNYVDKSIFKSKCNTFLADSAYNTFLNTINLTNNGFDVIFGRNKMHIKKGTIIKNASDEHKECYKKRGIVENFFGIIERYPCIINIYEKKRDSYKGLVVFISCIILAKKINKILIEKNNLNEKKKNEERIKINTEKEKEKKERRQKEKEIQNKIKEELNKKSKEHEKQLNEKINKMIIKNIGNKIIHDSYYIQKKNYKNAIKKKNLYKKYKKGAIESTVNYVRNNILSSTESFTFADKASYITITKKNTFKEENIQIKINNSKNEINNHIIKYAEIFFGDYG
jgi:hypothetical protein